MARLEVIKTRTKKRKTLTKILLVSFLFGAAVRCVNFAHQQHMHNKFLEAVERCEKQKLLAPATKDYGDFIITAYCGCKKCCGHTHRITKSGVIATPFRTVAVDSRVIPLGTRLYINGRWYIAEDTGGKINGKHVDVYFNTHDEALKFGRQIHSVKVEVINAQAK